MSAKYPILLALAMLFAFSACKKENDEQKKLSLRTKKARLTGKWHLIKGKASRTIPGYNESFTLDGTNLTLNLTSQNPVVYTGKYSLSLEIDKDGTFSFKDSRSGETLEASGTWNFNNGVGESKKKEEVIFSITEVQQGSTDNQSNIYNLFNRTSTTFTYKITKLTNKEMTISSSGKVLTDMNGNSETFSTEFVMAQ